LPTKNTKSTKIQKQASPGDTKISKAIILTVFFRGFRAFRGLCFSTAFDYQGHFLLEIT